MNRDNVIFKVKSQLKSTTDIGANLANIARILFEEDDISWAGFYIFKKDKLYLSYYQGKLACNEIEVGQGVCGTAFNNKTSIVVKDVHAFSGHIACDGGSNSELVVPLMDDDDIYGVIDLDSYSLERFNEEDRKIVEEVAHLIISNLNLKESFI